MPWPRWQRSVVEREGPQTESGKTNAPGASNVVPFPRDWFGPRDELVPIGQARPDPQPPADRSRTAADFWGEESAAVHDALQGPPPEPRHAGRNPYGAVALGRARRAGALLRLRWLGDLPARAAIGAVALVLVAAVYLAARPAGPDAPRSGQLTRRGPAAAATAEVAGAARREGAVLAASVLAAARHSAHRSAPSAVAARVRNRRHPRPHVVPTAPAVPAAIPAPATVAAPPASSEPAPTYPPTASSSASASSVAATRGDSGQAGPTGPAATFGPGY